MSSELRVPVHPSYAEEIRKDEAKYRAIARAALSFRYFLPHWKFQSPETGDVMTLGEVLWPGQLLLLDEIDAATLLYFLKARKLGFTTIECAYDAWVLRFRDRNARVHLFSRRMDAAHDLRDRVKFGLDRLPEWMRLPYGTERADELTLIAGPDDERTLKSYPADEDTAVEQTSSHTHLDEWTRMGNPRKVWQAVEPTIAGSCHILTTSKGPGTYPAKFWRDAVDGKSSYRPVFVPASARPGRDEAWRKKKAGDLDETELKQEYPETASDALYGGGDYYFDWRAIERVAEGARGRTPPEEGHVYVKAWDIGRHKDAAVGTVLDVTEARHQVVWYERMRRVPYPSQQERIERIHATWPGITVVEDNAAGGAVLENLNIPEDELVAHTTTKPSKARILGRLRLTLQRDELAFDPEQYPQLDQELRDYQLPDTHLVQDSVMSLAIAEAYAEAAWEHATRREAPRGRVLGVYEVGA